MDPFPLSSSLSKRSRVFSMPSSGYVFTNLSNSSKSIVLSFLLLASILPDLTKLVAVRNGYWDRSTSRYRS
ncbi:hypothetical protein BDV24DRAFT_133769 [Aspergillus arachidicola]|uniref:Uncharacterized protein n=1 Tax=Aspergillus arachidicola TaxID=656916 RepID=A0A5N6Y7C9_9EURO|nr:hypothetical protein BDV24DRAFT_133769 [Aspergillus arachidicola]